MIERMMDVTFPARDQALSRVVESLSEPDLGRTADNFVTNEDSFARVAGDLATRGGVYLGVGPDQNLTYVAHARPRLAIVLDFRRRNALLHLLHKALFQLSADRASYLGRLIARRPDDLPDDPTADAIVSAFDHRPMDRALLDRATREVEGLLRPTGLVLESEWPDLAIIQAKLAGPGLNARFLALPMYPTFGRMIASRDRPGQPAHFLAREDWYQAVRSIHLGDRLIPLTGDFAGAGAFPAIGRWLQDRALSVSVLYVSDVEFFLLRSGRFPAYVANLGRLPWLESAVLIRTSTREIDHPSRAIPRRQLDHDPPPRRPVPRSVQGRSGQDVGSTSSD